MCRKTNKRQRYHPQVESLEQRVTLDASAGVIPTDISQVDSVPRWHNETLPMDVNRDATVGPLDALLIINRINQSGASNLADLENIDAAVDVNGDGWLSAIDALLVVNQINVQSYDSRGVTQFHNGELYAEQQTWHIQSEEALRQAWAVLKANQIPLYSGIPQVDFTTDALAVFSWGGKHSGGYSIRHVGTEIIGDVATVKLDLISPVPRQVVSLAFTNPAIFVTVPSDIGQIQFETNEVDWGS